MWSPESVIHPYFLGISYDYYGIDNYQSTTDDYDHPKCQEPSEGPNWEVHYCGPILKYLPKCCKFGESINIRSRSCNEIVNFNANQSFFKGKQTTHRYIYVLINVHFIMHLK